MAKLRSDNILVGMDYNEMSLYASAGKEKPTIKRKATSVDDDEHVEKKFKASADPPPSPLPAEPSDEDGSDNDSNKENITPVASPSRRWPDAEDLDRFVGIGSPAVSETSTIVPDGDSDAEDVPASPLLLALPALGGDAGDGPGHAATTASQAVSEASTTVPEVGSELDEAGMCFGLLDVPSSSPDPPNSHLDVYYYPESSSELDRAPNWTLSTPAAAAVAPAPRARRHLIFYDDDQAVPTGEPEE